ncbi:MAG TPA: ABC transporter substrate-binding protein [Geobacteraceae bacterium]|nr:ABC transporter substrate-binding protein [Geobacteraceae bacterium]
MLKLMGKVLKLPGLLLVLSLPFFVAFAAEAGDDVVAGALKEKNLYIYGAVGRNVADPVVAAFEAKYPGIKVDFIEMSGSETFSRHMSDLGGRRVSADIIWSSEIELQAILLKDNYALSYHSPESGQIYQWANMGDLAYATAFEPVAMAYNTKLVNGKDLPHTHQDLLKSAAVFNGKIALCNPEKNGLSFMFLTQEMWSVKNFWKLVKGFEATGFLQYADYKALLDSIASGSALFGYNIPSRELFGRAKSDPSLGWFYSEEQTLAVPQSVLITKSATNPNSARLWVDFLLSKQGQEIISRNSDLYPVRGDAEGGAITKGPQKLPTGKAFKPILPGEELTRYNQTGLRRGFIPKWKQSLKLVK